MLISPSIKEIIAVALDEDIGSGDITTDFLVPQDIRGEALLIAKEEGVLAGLDLVREVFLLLDHNAIFITDLSDGDKVKNGKIIGRITANLQAILSGERTALNFLQHLSGIAGKVASWKKETEGYQTELVDTRKTTPGLRQLEKYAVIMGGARNHRRDLSGGVLIKENHIQAVGSIGEAVIKAKKNVPVTAKIEVEVTNLNELEEALNAGADIIMLDNMEIEAIKKAVSINKGKALLEVCGNVTKERIRKIAATGVDYISCGALTNSAPVLDISMIVVSKAAEGNK